jgi:hypothetical protein
MADTGLIDTIAAERDITRALNTYCRAIDRRDAELLISVYHPGAIDDHGGAFCGPAEDYVTWVVEHLLNFVSTMHTLHNILIDVDLSSSTARVESYCIAHHVRAGVGEDLIMDVFACRYLDQFEKRPDTGWRIAHRVVVREWRLRQPMLSEAEQPAGFALARRDRTDWSYAPSLPTPETH